MPINHQSTPTRPAGARRMTNREAYQALTEILGPLTGITYQGQRTATNPARRAEAQQRLTHLQAQRAQLDAEIAAVRDIAMGYRHRLYRRAGIFEDEIARGDTWEDIIEQVRARHEQREAPRG